MFHTTPQEITEEVAKFCKSISAHDPIFLDVQPWQPARQQECFGNVERRVEQDGGQRLLGWVIWYHPGVFIEAENHAVWQNATGDIIDITSPPSGETRVLFLRDDSAKPYPTTGLNSKRKALTKDPLVVKFTEYGHKIGLSNIKVRRGLPIDPNVVKLTSKMTKVQDAMIEKYGDAYP